MQHHRLTPPGHTGRQKEHDPPGREGNVANPTAESGSSAGRLRCVSLLQWSAIAPRTRTSLSRISFGVVRARG